MKNATGKTVVDGEETIQNYTITYTDKFKYVTTVTLSDTVEIPDIYHYKSNSTERQML